MGIDICSVFQKKDAGYWVDVPSNYNEDRDYDLYSWLGLGGGDRIGSYSCKPLNSLRGFPEDFEIIDGCDHPTIIKKRHQISSNPSCIFMGEWGHSWLLAAEILQTPAPRVSRTVSMPIDEYKQWDDPEYHPWQWATGGWSRKVGMPDNTNMVGENIIFEWNYDFTEEFNYFVNEVRRLQLLHGDVRFVFGFC